MHYIFGVYHLDTQRYELHHAGVLVPLRPKVFQVLAYLVAQHERVVHKEELLEALWPGQFVGDVGLNTYIMEVRKALGDRRPPHRYIRTVRGQGYRLVAPVEARDHAPPPPPLPAESLPVQEVPPRPLSSPAIALTAMVEAALAEPTMSHGDGEYKPVSVLCGGLSAAAVLAAGLDAEGLYRVMQTVVILAHEVLQAYGGTLIQQGPEGVTAVFGGPVAQEDHARRAVLAALDLQQRLSQHPVLGAGLALGIGIHSDLGVVGELGPVDHRQVTVMGAPVQGALRLQQQAAPGALLMSAATYHLVQTEVRGAPCGSLALEGWPAPLRVYAVQGLVPRHAGVPWRPGRSESPFVGRQREVALLHDRLEMVRAGTGQVLSLLGPPGIGKSRLLTEWRRQLSPEQVTWYTGQCLAYDQTTPYLPVRDIVQQVCGLAVGDPLEVRTAAVRQALAWLGGVVEEDVALLLQVLDLPVAPEALLRLSPETRQARTFTLLWHLLRQEAQQRPSVVVVEDVHWIDPTSAAWLTSLLDRLAGMAVLVLLTQRPGYQPPWGAHATVTQLALPPLHAEDSQAIVAAVPGTAQLPAVRRQQLVVHGAGNPFFVEELAWYAVEHDLSATSVVVPESVHAVLAARIDRLPLGEKQLLQTAAVIGHEIPLRVLQAIAELSEDALQRRLTHLQTAEFLYETSLFPECVYTFKHALTQEVAYSGLLHERQRTLHTRIVEALEALVGDHMAGQVERLAYHALRGEVWDKALTYARQAGEKALERSAYHEAVVWFEQALSVLPHLPETRDMYEQAIDLRGALGDVLWPLGEHQRRFAYLYQAATLATTMDDARRLSRISIQMVHHFRVMGDEEQAIAYSQQALTLAATLGDLRLQCGAHLVLGRTYYDMSEYRQAITSFRQVAASFAEERRPAQAHRWVETAVLSRVWLGLCLAEQGEFTEGRRHADAAIHLADTADHPYSRIHAYFGVGGLYLTKGDVDNAIDALEQSLGLYQRWEFPLVFPWIAAQLGYAYALAGRVKAALPLLEQAVQQITALRSSSHPRWVAWLSEAYLSAGRWEDASHIAERTYELSRRHKGRGHLAYALWLLGEIAVPHTPSEAEQAAAHYQEALALADALGMRPLQAHCHRGLGTLYGQTGRVEQARAELSAAIDLYRVLDMTFWLPPTEEALA
ncbi:MAG TPA: AAA family ATPase, partial [Candidatus Tectomicrobia bacterium]